ncbi:glycosyltransferase family 1 protein [Patescibacteria group bacterium]|nr:MAG: glycosyltransferase family 1 protein [Patescibacteria group bacterium]
MRVLVGARDLSVRSPSGVGTYATEVLRRMFPLAPSDRFTLLTTGMHAPDLTHALSSERRGVACYLPLGKGEHEGVVHVHRRVPNKLLNASVILTGRPTIDRLARGTFDRLFLPNLDIVSVPRSLPHVLTIHDLSWRLFPEWYSWKMRAWHAACRPERLIGNAATVLVPSNATADDLSACFPGVAGRIKVIPHGVADAFSPHSDPSDHGWRSKLGVPGRFLLFVGTLEPRKNVVALVDAVAAYRKRAGDDIALVLAGRWGWNAGALRRRLSRPDAQGWVRLLGYVPTQARPALYRAAEALVWPSHYEGFGLPVLEAMASGTPVITSLSSGVAETAGDAAILVDPLLTDDLTDAIGQLLGSSALRARLRDAGLRRTSGFGWEQAARLTLEAIHGGKV